MPQAIATTPDAADSLYRVEIHQPDNSTECFQCVAVASLADVIMPVLLSKAYPAGTIVRIYDYHRWSPRGEQGHIRSFTIDT